METGITLALLVVILLVAFYIIDSQASYGEDRASLMGLRETWSATAGSYGIRGEARLSSTDFVIQYQAFRARPSVGRLLSADPAFASAAANVDRSLYRLQRAESLGGPPDAAVKAASSLDGALAAMAGSIASYSRSRLDFSRRLILILVLLVAGIGVVFLTLERRVRAESAAGEGNLELARTLISAQEAERLRISHELHDAVAQDLAAAKLFCDLAARAPQNGDAAKAVALLERSIGEVRDICQGLRPVELDRLGVAEACARLCAENSRGTGLEVSFSAESFSAVDLGEAIEINLYRILQEALTNVRRHAKASRVDVTLSSGAVTIKLRVEDDGIGLGASKPGMGRRGMEERARMLGGGLEVSASPDGGAVVLASIPLPERETL
jgi:signal transduction histidine kinase